MARIVTPRLEAGYPRILGWSGACRDRIARLIPP